MKQAAIDFWVNHVIPRVPPEITEADQTTVTYYKTRYPDEWLKQFPTAEILPSLVLPQKTRFDVPAAKIGIAIVPPAE
jgi:hypothetical protein